MWLWQSLGPPYTHGEFCEVECPNVLDKLVLACGLANSRSEAQRLINKGEINIKRDAVGTGPFETLRDWKATIPAGWPYWVRRGHKPYPMQLLMFPVSGQSRFLWSQFWNDEPMSWWSWRLSGFCKRTVFKHG